VGIIWERFFIFCPCRAKGGEFVLDWGLTIFIWVGDLDEDGDVNLWDFGVFAGAWGAVDGVDIEYDPLCDLSDPVDGVIDAVDLGVFVDEWMIGPCR
jgi:hypothetical protein